MTTQKLPGTDAARHGTGDADLTIMLAAHDAFRRDLTRLARTAGSANLSDPARRQSIAAGWDLFKRQLHLHHTAEDEIIWPVLRPRLAHSPAALSVLDAMEAEHQLIDPLLAAVDLQFAGTGGDRLADVIDALTSALTGHLGHEERDGLPLIGVALTAAEWRGAGRKMAGKNGMAASSEMFAWILDSADREHAATTLAQLPPPLRLLYRALWKPRFDKTQRWLSRLEPVAHARLGEQVAGLGGFGFELATELGQVDPQVVALGFVRGTPHLAQQLPLRH
jgi:hemerythrin HHE cation binding domain-containing protein